MSLTAPDVPGPAPSSDAAAAADGSLPSSARDWLAASQATIRSVYTFGGSSSLPRALGEALYGGRYTLSSTLADITD